MSIDEAIQNQGKRINGRIALAGITFPPKQKFSSAKAVDFERISFRSPLMRGGWFSKTTIEDCRFTECSLGGIYASKSLFRNCSFLLSSIGKQFMAGFGRAIFENCTFTDTEIVSVGFEETSFLNCCFNSSILTDVKIIDTMLSGVTFDKCQFDGIVFSGGSLFETDFRTSTFLEVNFVSNVSLKKGIVFPESPENFILMDLSLLDRLLCKDNLPNDLKDKDFTADAEFLKKFSTPLVLDVRTFECLNTIEARQLLRHLNTYNKDCRWPGYTGLAS